jgi:hypothetical protein
MGLSADLSRRLCDFTPASADNPIVARIGDAIAIPASEYRAYRQAEKLHAITDETSLAQKRAVLDDLIGEYLYVDDAYRSGVAESPGFAKRMEFTRSLLLSDFLAAQTIERTHSTPEANAQAVADLGERLFEAATIEVSNETYARLKTAARAIDLASAASQRGPVVDLPAIASARLRDIVDRTADGVLARYQQKTITLKQILVIHAGLAAPRPPLDSQEALIAMLKPLILPDLLAAEAARAGIEALPAFQHKLIENRNALLRFHAAGVIEGRANETLKAPDLREKMQAWYHAHAADYALTDETGLRRVPTYAEVQQRVEGDFSVALRDDLRAKKAAELRAARGVTIDETVLRNL